MDVTIEGLDVSLVLTEVPPIAQHAAAGVSLTASVSDVAETFVHQELNELENRVLRETIHQAKTPTDSEGDEPWLPGALGPFMAGDAGNLPHEGDFEAEEVSFLTSLSQSLLSRLRVTVRNTSVATIDDDHAKMTFHIPEFHFGSEDTQETHEKDAEPQQPSAPVRTAVTRTFRISSISASMTDIERPRLVKTSNYGAFDGSDSSSSEDEMALKQMATSALSIKSSASMYHSALSLPPLDASTRSPISQQRSTAIFSIKDPILVHITSHPAASYRSSASPKPKIVASANIGVIAIALENWHVRAVLDLMRFIPQSTSATQVHAAHRPPTLKDTLLITMKVRACVALLVTPGLGRLHYENIDHFFARPLSPYTCCSHIRLQADQFEASLSKMLGANTSTPQISSQLDATVSDMAILYFDHAKPSSNVSLTGLLTRTDEGTGSSGSISPIMIFDPNLSQFPAAHRTTMYPFMDITTEWEKMGNMLRPSVWRVRAPKRDATGERHHVVSFNSTMSPEQSGEVVLLPIHLFIDPGVISEYIMPYLDGITSSTTMLDDDDDSVSSSDATHFQNRVDEAVLETPRPRHAELEVDEDFALASSVKQSLFVLLSCSHTSDSAEPIQLTLPRHPS